MLGFYINIALRLVFAGRVDILFDNKPSLLPEKCIPNKHETLTQSRCNVGSTSTTLVQHEVSIDSTSRVFWVPLPFCAQIFVYVVRIAVLLLK